MSLRADILIFLRGHAGQVGAREISTTLNRGTTNEVEFELKRLVLDKDVERHHSPTGLTYSAVTPAPGKRVAAPRVEQRPDELRTRPTPSLSDRVYALLASATKPTSARQLRDALGVDISSQRMTDALAWLRRSGRAQRVGEGTGSLWSAVPTPAANFVAPLAETTTESPAPLEPAANTPALQVSAAPEPFVHNGTSNDIDQLRGANPRLKGKAEMDHRRNEQFVALDGAPEIDSVADEAGAGRPFTYDFGDHVHYATCDIEELLDRAIAAGADHSILGHLARASSALRRAHLLATKGAQA